MQNETARRRSYSLLGARGAKATVLTIRSPLNGADGPPFLSWQPHQDAVGTKCVLSRLQPGSCIQRGGFRPDGAARRGRNDYA